jgi:hypothetical protein
MRGRERICCGTRDALAQHRYDSKELRMLIGINISDAYVRPGSACWIDASAIFDKDRIGWWLFRSVRDG